MKRIICILLSTAVLLCLFGCSSKSGEAAPAGQSQSSGSVPAEDQPSQEAEPEVKEEETVFELQRGTWDESRKNFINEVTGLKVTITVSDTYVASADEELAANFLGDSSIDLTSWTAEDLKTQISIPELELVDPFRGSNIRVMYENLKAENAAGVGEYAYLDAVLAGLRQNHEDISFQEVYDLELSSHTYKAIDVFYSSSDFVVQQTLAVRDLGDYMTIVIFTDLNDRENFDHMILLFNQ